MKAILRGMGEPSYEQRGMARRALAGAKVLCDLIAEKDWADICTITLDFEGDGITPAVIIDTVKWVPKYAPQNLQHHWVLDMSEVFGEDNADNALLRQIVSDIEFAITEELEARERNERAYEKRRIEL